MPPRIEAGIPLPPRIGRPPKYDFTLMKIGDSFWAPVTAGSLRACARRAACSMLAGTRFVCRVESDGARCWRVS